MSQQLAIEAIEAGQNVFVTGPAGVGKSYLIDQVYNESTVLLAPTGIAALNIGGSTCHKVFALPIGLVTRKDETTIPSKVADLFKVNGGVERIIIDEVGMLRADMLDLIDTRLKLVRNNSLPFGGIQMVVIGDLYQLETILPERERLYFKKKYKTPFCFGAKCWDFPTISLTKV